MLPFIPSIRKKVPVWFSDEFLTEMRTQLTVGVVPTSQHLSLSQEQRVALPCRHSLCPFDLNSSWGVTVPTGASSQLPVDATSKRVDCRAFLALCHHQSVTCPTADPNHRLRNPFDWSRSGEVFGVSVTELPIDALAPGEELPPSDSTDVETSAVNTGYGR